MLLQPGNQEDPIKPEIELIIETISDAVIVVDRNGIVTFANRAAETIFCINRREMYTRTYNASAWMITTIEGEPYPEDKLPVSLVLKSRKPVHDIEFAVECFEGKRVILSVSAVPLFDEKGNISSVVTSFADITKHKIVELALQESEGRLRKFLKEINMIAGILDVQGNIMFANDSFLELTGETLASVVGKNFLDTFVISGQKEEIRQLFHESLNKGKVSDIYKFDIETKEGEKHTISFVNAIIYDMAGNIAGIASIGEDITERNKSAEEIKESRRQVLDVLESITDGFFALDNDWRFTYINRRAEEFFAAKRENLLFRNIWKILPHEDAPGIFERFHLAKQQMTPAIFEEFVPRFDKWVEIHVYSYKKGLSVYFRDVTERKQAEQERLVNLHFLESMDRVDQAIQGTNDLEQMMNDVLDTVFSIFNCDRVFLLYPCDPTASKWTVSMERTRPEYHGVFAVGIKVPIDPDIAEMFRILRNSSGPVKFDLEHEYSLPAEVVKRFKFQSFIGIALYPKIGKPWEFGLHQCSYPRNWTHEEEKLFQQIGIRLSDNLTSLSTYRRFQER